MMHTGQAQDTCRPVTILAGDLQWDYIEFPDVVITTDLSDTSPGP